MVMYEDNKGLQACEPLAVRLSHHPSMQAASMHADVSIGMKYGECHVQLKTTHFCRWICVAILLC